jgi:hypothetical protein
MRFLIAGLLSVVLLGSLTSEAQTYVRGYTNQNGTYVQGYNRTRPDGNIYNNYSTRGNINPYTGQQGTVNPYRSNYTNQPYANSSLGLYWRKRGY